MNEQVKQENKKTNCKNVDIYPCKRSRRILAFLGDFFLSFIACIFLFEIVVRPSAFAIVDAKKIADESTKAEENNMNLLYDNDILYYDSNVSNPDFTKRKDVTLDEAIKTSCDVFTFEIMNSSAERKHDAIFNYLTNFKGKNEEEILAIYQEKGSTYFDINLEEKSIKLNAEYSEKFKNKFNDKDKLSEDNKKEYENYQEKFFLNVYSEYVLMDIKENDLACVEHPEYSTYLTNANLITEYNDKMIFVGKISAVVVFAVVMTIFYIIVPLVTSKGQTIFEMALKIERIDIKYIGYLKKRFILSEGLLNILENTPMLCFIPIISYQFGPLLRMPELFSIGLVGLVFVIIQFFLMMFTKLNRSLKEYSTRSICIDTSTMDNYFREKGYDF